MKNENKIRGRGVQFGLKRENQNNPKSKNQKKITLRGRGIKVKKLNREKREKRGKKRRMKKREEEGKEGKEREKENEKTSTRPPDHRRRNQRHHPSRGFG